MARLKGGQVRKDAKKGVVGSPEPWADYPPDAQLERVLSVRFNDHELALLDWAAKEQGRTRHGLIRRGAVKLAKELARERGFDV